MLMSSGGLVASSSGCATRPRAREVGSTGYTMPTQYSLLIGRYVMATAEHREPCDSRGSCTVLGAPGGEIPPGDSSFATGPPRFPAAGVVIGAKGDVLTNAHVVEGCQKITVKAGFGNPETAALVARDERNDLAV